MKQFDPCTSGITIVEQSYWILELRLTSGGTEVGAYKKELQLVLSMEYLVENLCRSSS
jgi:hypothetical protein